MSISGVGASGAGYASQLLASFLAQMSNTQSVSNDDSFSCSQAGDASASSDSSATAQNALTGTGKGSLSGELMQVLMQMQQDSQTGETGASTDSTSPSDDASSSASSDSTQNAFSTIDTNGDGVISPSELAAYLAQQKDKDKKDDQADQVDQSDPSQSDSIQTRQMPETAKLHSHHHPHMRPDAQNMASQFINTLDTDGDGSVSANELDSFVTDNGGTSDQATSIFSNLDADGSGNVSQSEFLTVLNNLGPGPWSPAQGAAAYGQAQSIAGSAAA